MATLRVTTGRNMTGLALLVAAVIATWLVVWRLSTHAPSTPTSVSSDLGDVMHEQAQPKAGSAPPTQLQPLTTARIDTGWARSYRDTTDYVTFMRQAVVAAQQGDSGAQFYVGKLLQLCGGMSVEMTVMKALADAKSVKLPVSLAKKRESQAEQCRLLLQDTEIFAALPPREGGYPASYWLKRSAEQGNPSASADIARSTVRERQMKGMGEDPVAANRPLEEAERSLQQAIANSGGDAEALFLVGEALFNARRKDADDRQLRGAAWMLVACERGYDCSLMNDKNEMARALALCHEWKDPNCPEGSDVTQYIRNLGQENFDKAVVFAQKFRQALDSSDSHALLQSVSMK